MLLVDYLEFLEDRMDILLKLRLHHYTKAGVILHCLNSSQLKSLENGICPINAVVADISKKASVSKKVVSQSLEQYVEFCSKPSKYRMKRYNSSGKVVSLYYHRWDPRTGGRARPKPDDS